MSEEKSQITIGNLESNTILMLYLLSKYNDENCIFFPMEVNPRFLIKKEYFYLNNILWSCSEQLTKDKSKYHLTCDFTYPYGRDFFSKIYDICPYENIFVLPLLLMFISREGKHLYHANMLIYNKELNVLERFEPHGKSSITIHKLYNEKKLNEELNVFAKNLGGENCRYISPMNYCPDLGIQRLIEREDNDLIDLCSIWTFIYTDYRLKYPEKTREEIIDELVHIEKREDIKTLARKIISHIKTIYDKLLQTKTNQEIVDLIRELEF